MNIVGEKVYLRALEEKDCDMLLRIINDPETEKMLGGYSFPVSSLAQKDWLIHKANGKDNFRCAIVPNGQEDAVGTAILSDINEKDATAEIHIKMDSTSRGQGYGTDAINALVKYGFEQLRLNCIYAIILESNEISQNMFKKCGFEFEGVLKARMFKDGEYKNLCSYSKIK